MAQASRQAGTRIPALIEIDCDGHRSGVLPTDRQRLLDIAGIDDLVIDLPPGMPEIVPRLIAKARVVLVPVRATPLTTCRLSVRPHEPWRDTPVGLSC